MLTLVARRVSINIFFVEHVNCPQVVRKPVHFIVLQDITLSHAACTEIDIKAKEIQLT